MTTLPGGRRLADITHLIIDMDGVLYRGDEPMPRLGEFFAFLRAPQGAPHQRPIPFILATNNSTHTPEQYVAKLARMGVEVFPGEILTSGQATARFLARQHPPGRASTSLVCLRCAKPSRPKALCWPTSTWPWSWPAWTAR